MHWTFFYAILSFKIFFLKIISEETSKSYAVHSTLYPRKKANLFVYSNIADIEEDVLSVLNLWPKHTITWRRNRNKKIYTQHNLLLFTLYNSNISAINIHHTNETKWNRSKHTHIPRGMLNVWIWLCVFYPTNSIINHWYFIRHLKRWMICANEISIIYGSIRVPCARARRSSVFF